MGEGVCWARGGEFALAARFPSQKGRGPRLLQLGFEHGAATLDDDLEVDLAPVRFGEELCLGFAETLGELLKAHGGSIRLGPSALIAFMNTANLIFRER